MKLKRFSLIVILLFLAFITTGCVTSSAYYNIQNGQKINCTPSLFTGDGTCTWPYYEFDTSDDGTTALLACSSLGQCTAVTPTADTSSAVTPTADTPTAQCAPSYAYDNLTDEGQSWVVVTQQQDQNNTSSPAQVTFTSTTSKTVTVTDKQDVIANLSATAGFDAGILMADITLKVKAEIDHEVTQTVDATIGNSYTASIPPGETAYANYGVKVQITSGHLYDKAGCAGKKSDWGTDVTYVPIAAGWCVWLSNHPSCPSL